MAYMQRMDAMWRLNDQVKKLEAEGGIKIGGTPKRLFCFTTGDGRVMMSGSCWKCWNCNLKYDKFLAHLFAIADFLVLARSHWLPYVLHASRPQCWRCVTVMCKGRESQLEASKGQCPHMGLTKSPNGRVPLHF